MAQKLPQKYKVSHIGKKEILYKNGAKFGPNGPNLGQAKK